MVPVGWRSRVSRVVSVAGGSGMKPALSIAKSEISETGGR
jgi:NAD(P)H-flavin reductase